MKALLAAVLAMSTAAAPVEDVRLRGRILGSDGVPAVNLDVAVTADPGAAGTVFGLFGAALTGGLGCLAPPPNLCDGRETWTSRTDGAGRYEFLFPQAHEVGVETDTDYVLHVASPRGATASYELELIDAVQDAPDLRLWEPLVEIDERDGRTTVAFDPLDGGEVRVLFMAGDVAMAEGDAVDARLLEDAATEVVLIGSRDVRRARTIYHQRFRSAPRPWRGADVPPSRGKPCALGAAPPGPCPLTDGAFTVPPALTQVTVDVGAPVDADLVVVRGCGLCGAETSADGQAWSPLPRDGRAGGRPVRFVRLADASGVSEVSVWPAPPPRPAPETAAQDGDGGAAGGAGDEDDDRRGPLAAVAAVLLAAVGAALARRRPA